MKNYSEFHDGRLEGFQIDGSKMSVFLRNEIGKGTTVVASGVEALAAGGFRSGNIIFEVIVRNYDEVTADDIAQLYDFAQGPERSKSIEKMLANANCERLKILEINPSYGGTILLLASSIDFIPTEM